MFRTAPQQLTGFVTLHVVSHAGSLKLLGQIQRWQRTSNPVIPDGPHNALLRGSQRVIRRRARQDRAHGLVVSLVI